MDKIDLVKTATWLANQGFPIIAISPGSKRPTREWKSLQSGISDENMGLIQQFIADLYPGEASSFAIVCGPRGMIAIDIDAKKDGEPVPESVVAKILDQLGLPRDYPWHWRSQSGRGWHIWVRAADMPSNFSRREIAGGADQPYRAIEIRGWGHCAIVPPNLPSFPSELPPEIPWSRIMRLMPGPQPDIRLIIERELHRVMSAAEGTRNNSLNVAAYNLGQWVGRGALNRARVEKILLESTALPYREAARTIKSGLDAGIRDANQLPRGRRLQGWSNSYTADIAQALLTDGYRFFYNEESGEILKEPGKRIEEADIILLKGWMRDRQFPLYMAEIVIYYIAMQNPIRPIRDGLEALDWDGGNYISALASHLYLSEDTPQWLAERWLSLWMIGAVGKVFERWQNPVLVLEGPQGVGKSFLARWLGSVIPNAFLEESVDPHAKDSLLLLTRYFIWEIPELDSITSRHDAAALKHFVTRESVTVRPPYGRTHIERPAITSMIATVNDRAAGYLPDETGNRRFLILPIEDIDHSYSQKLSPAQIWGEAVARWRAGERPYLDSEDIGIRDEIAEMRQTMGAVDEWLRLNIIVTGKEEDTLSLHQIINRLRDSDFPLGGNDWHLSRTISQGMARLKIPRKKIRTSPGHQIRVWVGVRFL